MFILRSLHAHTISIWISTQFQFGFNSFYISIQFNSNSIPIHVQFNFKRKLVILVFRIYGWFWWIRLIIPKFRLTSLQTNSFPFNASKIINFLLQSDISYSGYLLKSFKGKLKSLLMFRQSLCIKKDPNWLPLNYNTYSDVDIDNLKSIR